MTIEPDATKEGFHLRVAFYRQGAAVIETRGAAHRKTAGLLARVVRALARPGAVLVVDVSEHTVADYWLVSAVAKAHAAAQGAKADLHVMVSGRPALDVMCASGLDRVISVSSSRGCAELPEPPAGVPSRTIDRQRVIDLSAHGTAARDRALAASRMRWQGPPPRRS